MDVVMCGRASIRRDFIESCIRFFANKLKLDRHRIVVVASSVRGLAKNQDAKGGIVQEDRRIVSMFLDSSLKDEMLVQTIAHEMIHVKQIATGRLTCFVKDGEIENVWRGQKIVTDYHLRPWEVEAFRRERELAYSLWSLIKGR